MPGSEGDSAGTREDGSARRDNAEEAELVNRAKAHPQAFGELYERYYSRILCLIYRRTLDAEVAEELTSNTFFKALRALPRYDHRGRFGAWLYRIALNEIKLHRRTASSRRDHDPNWREELTRIHFASRQPDGEGDVEAKMHAFAELHDTLCRLPERYQVVFSLRYSHSGGRDVPGGVPRSAQQHDLATAVEWAKSPRCDSLLSPQPGTVRPMPAHSTNLRRLMAQFGLTIGQVAERSGLDRRTARGILRGTTTAKARTLRKLVASQGVSADELFLEPSLLLQRNR
jgi:RNA polymerase sigma-70 factor (ECF subfamily)